MMKLVKLLVVFFVIAVSFSKVNAQYISLESHLYGLEYGVITSDNRVLSYKINKLKGELEFTIKDEQLQTLFSKKQKLAPNIYKFTYEEDPEFAYLFISYGSGTGYKKILIKIDFQTGELVSYPISSTFVFPLSIRPIQDGIVMLGSLLEGDFLEIFNYKKQELYSISEFFGKDTRVWDLQVVDDQVDLLIFTQGKKRYQEFQILSYNKEGLRTLKIPINIPKDKKLNIRSAQLLYGPYDEHKIVGTYSFKPGEWFSGYFQIEVNEFLEQSFTKYPFKEFSGFYAFQRNSNKKRKHFHREMKLVEAVTDGEYITLAAQPVKTNKKFIHFMTLDGESNKSFDKSIKLYFNNAIYSGSYQLGNQATDVYFLFRGNDNKRNLPGEKVYKLQNGELKSVNQVNKLYKEDSFANLLTNPKYKHWYGNKFLVFGIVQPEAAGTSEPVFVVEVIEV
ncbi:hypothetical protein [Mongoliitalea daihaiensis]|uniref:hypothetical protein n=1 Tax=Mongoliitalea daihaiensis TaxID=2782006 RepID=UPI001F233CE1|nr:hypothetical protein [Mongoliitalea daihaiensis]UJP65033.1 hypothetical protein IPZ59_20025 [Mongoliitalea daihaiensis]